MDIQKSTMCIACIFLFEKHLLQSNSHQDLLVLFAFFLFSLVSNSFISGGFRICCDGSSAATSPGIGCFSLVVTTEMDTGSRFRCRRKGWEVIGWLQRREILISCLRSRCSSCPSCTLAIHQNRRREQGWGARSRGLR